MIKGYIQFWMFFNMVKIIAKKWRLQHLRFPALKNAQVPVPASLLWSCFTLGQLLTFNLACLICGMRMRIPVLAPHGSCVAGGMAT